MMENPIFIGGCGSSGTTLLRKILNAHPNIAIGPEMSVFDRPMIYAKPFNYLVTAVATESYELFEPGQIFPIKRADGGTYFGLAEGNHGPKHYHATEYVKENIGKFESTKEFLTWYFGEFAIKQGATRWGEKSPNNIFFVPNMFEMFPAAKFIEIVRDGRDVVLSLINRRKYHLHSAVFRWLISVNAGRAWKSPKFSEIIHDRSYAKIKYEDLVTDPEKSVRFLCDFLALPFKSEMLEFYKTPPGKKIEAEFDDKGMNFAVSEITDRKVGVYKSADLQLVNQIEAAILPNLVELGYE
jgi:hypothetical protein